MTTKRDPAAGKARVFLVDDHPIVRRGFQLLLSLEPDLAVCGEADSGPEALERVPAAKPDVAIVDLGLKASSGLDLIKQLRLHYPRLRILVFSMRNEAIYAERSLRAGANGYITKEEGTERAIEAIRLLLQGKRYLSSRLAERIMDKLAGGEPGESAVDLLSDREIEVLELLGNGMGSREIAEQLHLSIKTIESHREHLKTKLGLKGAAELVRYAFNWVQSERTEGEAGGRPTTRRARSR